MSNALATDAAVAADTHELGSRVRKGAVWNGIGTLVLKVSNIGLTAIVVRIVSPEEFGTFAVALALYTVVSSMSDFGVLSVLHRGDIDVDDLAPTAATIALGSCCVLAAGLFLGAPVLADAFGTPGAVASIRVIALVVVIYGIFAVPAAILAREFRQDRIFFANMIAFIPSNLLLVVLAVSGDGALAFAWSRVLGQLVVGVATTLFVTRRYFYGLARRPFRFLIGVGLPLAGANLIGYVLLNADYLFIGHRLGAASLGIYMLAFNVANITTSLLSSMLNSVALPAFSRVRRDPDRLADAVVRAHRLLALIAWPLCAIMVASATPLIEVIYGHQWAHAAAALALLAPYGAIFIHSLLYANLLVGGAAQTRALLAVQVLWLALLVPAMLIGVSAGGTTGVAAAHLFVLGLVVMPVYLWTTRRLCGVAVGPSLRAVAPIIAAAAVAGAADAVVSAFVPGNVGKLFLGSAAAVLVYLALVAPALLDILSRRGPDAGSGRFHLAVTVLDRCARIQYALRPSRRPLGRHARLQEAA